MFSLFPVHRPSLGIGISARSLSLIALRRLPFCQPAVTRVAERPIQDGWDPPTGSSPNIAGMGALTEELGALTKSLSDRSVAITLPDESATIGVFTFETLPKQQQELETVIRWRFQQEADLKVARERLVYRLFPGEKAASVLAAAVNQAVLNQYLSLLDSARLLPVSIGFESFQLFDAYRSVMDVGTERFFVHYNGRILTFLAFVHGRPVFLRKRRLRSPSLVHDELLGTLQYFEDRFPYAGENGHMSKLFFIDTSSPSDSKRIFDVQTTMSVPAVQHTKLVEVIPLDGKALPINTAKAEVYSALLPVAAGLGIA